MPKSVSCGPYVPYRDGRPRFVPGPAARALGFQGKDLKHGDGRWFTFEEARAFALENAQAIEARRAGGKPKRQAAARAATVENLLEDFLAAMARGEPGPNGRPLAPDAIASYRKAANAVIYLPEARPAAAARREKARAAGLLGVPAPARRKERFAVTSLAAVGKVELQAFYLHSTRARGHHMALSMVSVISAAWTWGGTDPRWRLGANPRHELRLARPAGRIVVYEAAEIEALIAAADALVCRTDKSGAPVTRRSIGDAILLGVDTGQRQRDRLLLHDEGLFDGRRRFRQHKTGMVVEIRQTARLAARLAQAKQRAAALRLELGTRDDVIVLDETTGRPYEASTYRHVFAAVRELAFRGSDALGLTACPSLQFVDERCRADIDAGRMAAADALDMKTDQDLRDTCVTRLYRAGVEPLAICDITGHTYKSVQTIFDHYLARDRVRADAAIDKLEAWMAQGGG